MSKQLLTKNALRVKSQSCNLSEIEAIGARITAKRVSMGLSQDSLAKISGLSRHKVSNIENGKGGTLSDTVKICKVIKSSMAYIFGGCNG